MLVAQGVRASEFFLDTKYDNELLDKIYAKICRDKTNIVLIGMPASGKTTVGAILSVKLGRDIVDIDDEIDAVTVGGWAMEVLGKIPEVGDTFEDNGVAVEILEMDGRRVESVHVLDKREDETDEDDKSDEDEDENDNKQQSFFK